MSNVVRMNSDSITKLEKLYTEFEKLKTEAKERQDIAKGLKEEIVDLMNDLGRDDVIINGWDGLIKLEITYPERTVLNKKGLADAIGVAQKELSNPHRIIQLTQEGLLTPELYEQYTETEERMQFSAKDYRNDEEEEAL